MHSSRMCTARSLIISLYLIISHACPPGSNHVCPPGATMHIPPTGTTMHTPSGATMHAPPEQPCMPPWEQSCMPPRATAHAPWEQPRMPPRATTHTPREQPRMPPLWTEWQTGVKILPCPKFRLRAVKIKTNQTAFRKPRIAKDLMRKVI